MERLWLAITKPVATSATSERGRFLNLLDKHFSESDLREAAFELGIEYDNLPGETKRDNARELIITLKHEGREYQLTAWVQQRRPQIIWPSLDTGPLDQGKK